MKFAHGMTASAWFPLLARNHFAVSPSRIPISVLFCLGSLVNSSLSALQGLVFSRDINRIELGAPVFIIGHWRTGTTWVHEMLARDKRFVAPNTVECFLPAQCLVAGWLARLFPTALPRRRPMDGMAVGWDRPQEDEFALLNLGLGSPYETIIFPNHRPVRHEFFNMRNVSPEQLKVWETGFTFFLKQVMYRARRQAHSDASPRLLLKSPPHTARIELLRHLFPQAQFIHLVRHPYEIFVSTLWLWQTLFDVQGCQRPVFDRLPGGRPDLETYVLDTMELLYRDVPQALHATQFCQVRYEDMVRDPLAQARRIYEQLDLGPFDAVRPGLEAYLAELKDYEANEYQISAAQKAAVLSRWRWYFEKYDYAP